MGESKDDVLRELNRQRDIITGGAQYFQERAWQRVDELLDKLGDINIMQDLVEIELL